MESINGSGKEPVYLSATNGRKIIDQYDTFLMDCDGVLWDNDQVTRIDGIADTIDKLRTMGKRLYFMSNNPLYSAESFAMRFQTMAGFKGHASEVLTVNDATGTYLREKAQVPQGAKVYVIGPKPLSDVLENVGFQPFGAGRNPEPLVEDLSKEIGSVIKMKLEEDVKAVAVALDPCFDYNKWIKAINFIQNPDCAFVGISHEPSLKVGAGSFRRMIPVNGSIVSAVECASGRQATLVGKPSRHFFLCLQARDPQINPARTVMVGDILSSDIAFAANSGIDSVLVCTGKDNEKTLAEARAKNPNTPVPTYILSGLAELGQWL